MRPRLLASSFAVVLVLSAALPAAAVGPSNGGGRTSVIVVFDNSVSDPAALAAQLGRQHGFTARHVYGTALKGFVASVPEEAVAALSAHPRVQLVETEVEERIVGDVPTGVDRVEVDKNIHAGVDDIPGPDLGYHLAIIDTGISPHPDAELRIGPGVSYAGGDTSDGNGHGTHVAGTVAARDNGVGVVGVAPGAWVHPVKVCKNGGICLSGDIIAGINWVAQQKDTGAINFAAANFSISSSDAATTCDSDGNGVTATHTAICGLVAQGVVFAMAAGNDGRAKDAYPEAFTVAAIADFDGKGGGAGSPTCRSDVDETLADFSNWSKSNGVSKVDIAAPGVCILSTWNDGGYNTISGTSMATPHVTGAVALYLHVNSKLPAQSAEGVAAIETAIVAAAHPEGTKDDAGTTTNACSYDNERGTSEPLLFVNDKTHFLSTTGACEVVTAGGGGGGGGETNAPPTASFTVSCSALTCAFDGSGSSDADGGNIVSWSWDFGDGTTGTGDTTSHTYEKRGNYRVTLTVTDDGGASDSETQSVKVR